MKTEPLSYRMCPKTLEDIVGQVAIIGRNTVLSNMIVSGNLSSMILCGPPGTGKTSIAKIIAATTRSKFKKLNAVVSGVSDIKRVIEEAENIFFNNDGKTILFIDEIHRFNKAQQDLLLPYVEDGTFVLIGATTENPFYEINKALLSRMVVFQLVPHTNEDIKNILLRAISDKERGLGSLDISIDSEAIDFICNLSSGDARIALNTLEMAVKSSMPSIEGKILLDVQKISSCISKKVLKYDKNSDTHYDTISALIKSMRGSDPDASVFYLARALYAGEDPLFLARRIVIFASEDIGMANPQALNIAMSAFDATKVIGMPEARIILSQAVIFMATSPKSRSCYAAISMALADVENKNVGEIPMHIRNNPIKEYSDAPLSFMPKSFENTVYYIPSENGHEKNFTKK